MLPLPGHGGGGRQLWVPQVLAPTGIALPASVSNGAMQEQWGLCLLGGVMGDPYWSPLAAGTPPPWAAWVTSTRW